MTDERAYGFGTRCVHAGQETADPATDARAPPIYQTSSYVFENAETAADRYALDDEGNVYSRFDNPTVAMLERRLASLENASGALATGSGMAALDATTSVLASAGDNIVSAASIYGGTHSYFSNMASRRGVEPRYVDTLDPDAYASAIDESTAYVHCETIANPSLVTPDFEALATVTHDHGVPLVVDNTFGTPALCNPLEYGVDIVWESTTKWIHGSGTTVGGLIAESGEFPWDEYPERYPELARESPAFAGVTFAADFPENPFTTAARQRAVRSLGDGQKPFDAWVTMQGAETLALRMERHCTNAMTIAEFLADHPAIDWVNYPGLPSHETHDTASTYLDGGYGGMVTFGPAGGYEAAVTICEETDLAQFLANIGDAKTLITHPASTTHAQLDPDQQRASGVTPDMIRLSVGIEDVADLLADLQAAIVRASDNGRESRAGSEEGSGGEGT